MEGGGLDCAAPSLVPNDCNPTRLARTTEKCEVWCQYDSVAEVRQLQMT